MLISFRDSLLFSFNSFAHHLTLPLLYCHSTDVKKINSLKVVVFFSPSIKPKKKKKSYQAKSNLFNCILWNKSTINNKSKKKKGKEKNGLSNLFPFIFLLNHTKGRGRSQKIHFELPSFTKLTNSRQTQEQSKFQLVNEFPYGGLIQF